MLLISFKVFSFSASFFAIILFSLVLGINLLIAITLLVTVIAIFTAFIPPSILKKANPFDQLTNQPKGNDC